MSRRSTGATTARRELVEGRRSAGYVVASGDSRASDDPGIFVEIPLVNRIRPRVKAWRKAGYLSLTSITRRLLEHWRDPEAFDARRFFCRFEEGFGAPGVTETWTTS